MLILMHFACLLSIHAICIMLRIFQIHNHLIGLFLSQSKEFANAVKLFACCQWKPCTMIFQGGVLFCREHLFDSNCFGFIHILHHCLRYTLMFKGGVCVWRQHQRSLCVEHVTYNVPCVVCNMFRVTRITPLLCFLHTIFTSAHTF